MHCPNSPEEWKEVADEFSKRWNFHNTIGVIDEKHVAQRCPPSAGSLYYNYKGFHSVILLALVDAEYKFLFTDVGANGNCSDSTIFKECDLFDALQTGNLKLPEPEPLPKDNQPLPYYIVGDDAFGLRTWLMKPYPHCFMTIKQRIYNYRLSRAQSVVENAFGILVHRFRCMLTTMQQHPRRVQSIVMACCQDHA